MECLFIHIFFVCLLVVLWESQYICGETYAAFHMSALMGAGFGQLVSLFFLY